MIYVRDRYVHTYIYMFILYIEISKVPGAYEPTYKIS